VILIPLDFSETL